MSGIGLSFVIPVFNEEEGLPELFRRLTALFSTLDLECEVILVDDGSRDDSWQQITELSRLDPRFRGLRLSRNFGHQTAITAGIDIAEGDAVVIMDADLQHPPEFVPEMIARWRDGFDVVYAVREDRTGESSFKRLTAIVFYGLLRRMTDVEMPAYVGDFRLVDRGAIDAFRSLRERNRYVRGMFSWIGFRQIGVPCPQAPRHAGRSKYTPRRMARLAIDGLLGFSNVPLRLALGVGSIVSTAAFLGGILAIAFKAGGIFTVPGWASIVVVVSFLGGFQLTVLGVIGAYIGRIYDEVKARPLYLVTEVAGIELPRAETPAPGANPAAMAALAAALGGRRRHRG